MVPKILHVDDDDDIREVVLIALELIGGLDVEQCSSGEEALERAPSIKPGLFLLDVMMPGLTGPETLSKLWAMPQFASTPAIFMTAKANREDLDELLRMGALDVITKPFDPMTVSGYIVEIWNRGLMSGKIAAE